MVRRKDMDILRGKDFATTPAKLDRRAFLRLGAAAATVPLLGACTGEEDDELGSTSLRSAGIEVAVASGSSGLAACECLMSASLAATLQVEAGDQLRITKNPMEQAVYTVAGTHSEHDPTRVYVSSAGVERLGGGTGFAAGLDADVPANLSAGEAESQGEFIEEVIDPGGDALVVCVPHGGGIARHTDDQGEHLIQLLTEHQPSLWRARGWNSHGCAAQQWYVASDRLSAASFPKLATLGVDRFAYGVSFEAMADEGIMIGGTIDKPTKDELKHIVITTVNDPQVAVGVAPEGHPLARASVEYLPNRLTAGGLGGLCIAQGALVREHYGTAVADAVAQFLSARL